MSSVNHNPHRTVEALPFAQPKQGTVETAPVVGLAGDGGYMTIFVRYTSTHNPIAEPGLSPPSPVLVVRTAAPHLSGGAYH